MAVYQGTEMRLKFGTKTLFHETSAKFNISKNFEELASKDIAGKEVIPGSYDWGLSADSLISLSSASAQEDVQTLLTALIDATVLSVEFSTQTTGDLLLSGDVYVSSADVDSQHENGVTGSFEFKGTGSITVGVVV